MRKPQALVARGFLFAPANVSAGAAQRRGTARAPTSLETPALEPGFEPQSQLSVLRDEELLPTSPGAAFRDEQFIPIAEPAGSATFACAAVSVRPVDGLTVRCRQPSPLPVQHAGNAYSKPGHPSRLSGGRRGRLANALVRPRSVTNRLVDQVAKRDPIVGAAEPAPE